MHNHFISGMPRPGRTWRRGHQHTGKKGFFRERFVIPAAPWSGSTLLAVRVVCPFLDDLFGRPATTAVVPLLRGRAVVLLLILSILVFTGSVLLFFGIGRTGGLLLVMPVKVPPPATVTGTVPPVIPPLPGTLALRGPGSLLRRLLPGCLWLRVLFCHNCQTD
jgi:hypothetical protein